MRLLSMIMSVPLMKSAMPSTMTLSKDGVVAVKEGVALGTGAAVFEAGKRNISGVLVTSVKATAGAVVACRHPRRTWSCWPPNGRRAHCFARS